jgi:REP element-mobilizing transposase RayT
MKPIYASAELKAAYQLNWSLSAFTQRNLPASTEWLEQLKIATERDGVRVLEYRRKSDAMHQFFVSTKPTVEPCDIARSVKGRLQHLLRDIDRKLFCRKYALLSVGAANDATLGRYVASQTSRHPMADIRVQEMLKSLQYHDPMVHLDQLQSSNYARFVINFHLVLETREHFPEIREDILRRTRHTIIRTADKHHHRLSQIGLVSNHLHLLLGCGLNDAPLSVAAAYLNNIAHANDRKRILEPSFYVGTFGPYNRAAIWRNLAAG